MRYLIAGILTVLLLPSLAAAQMTIGGSSGIGTAGPLPVNAGGNGCGPAIPFSKLPSQPVIGASCTITDATSCTAGTPVSAGGGSNKCFAIFDGTSWQPAGGAISAGTGGITAVNVTAPITSTGGASPTIGFTAPVTAAQGGTNSTTNPTSTQIPIANSSNTYVPQTVSGDCTIGATGVVTCLKTNGGAFTGLATASVPLSIANGGTGSTVPGSTVGSGLSVSGTFPTQQFSIAAPVSIANGGTGSTTVGLTAGTGLSVSGTFPKQQFSLTTPVTVANGGTQCGAPVAFASLPGSPTIGEICYVTDSSVGCVAGTPVTAGSGATKCQVTWDGANWQPGGSVTSASAGGVTSVGVTAPITTTGGATPTIALTVPLAAANGGSGLTSPSAHNLEVAEGASAVNLLSLASDQVLTGVTGADPTQLAVPNCSDTGGQHINYSTTTHTFTCGSTCNPATSINASSVNAGTFSGAFTFASAPTMSGANITSSTIPTSAMATTQGNGTKVQLSTGSTTTNDCVKFDANGNTVDTGAACGSANPVNTPTETGNEAYYAASTANISGVAHIIHAGTGTLAAAFTALGANPGIVIADPGQIYTVSSPLTWGTTNDQTLMVYGRINCTDTTGGRDCLDIDVHGHLVGNGVGAGSANNGCVITDSATANITSLVTNASHTSSDGFDIRNCLLDSNTNSQITKAVFWLSGAEGFNNVVHISITAPPTGGASSGVMYQVDDNGGTRQWNQIDNDAVNLACSNANNVTALNILAGAPGVGGQQFTWTGGSVVDCGTGSTLVNVDGNNGSVVGVWFNGTYFETHGAGNDLIKVANAYNVHMLGLQFTEANGGIFSNCIHITGSAANVGELEFSGRMVPTACTNLINDAVDSYTTTTAGNFSYYHPGSNGITQVIDYNGLIQGWGPGKNGITYSAAGTAIPTCASNIKNLFACVSDSTACTSGTTYTSGGGTSCMLECNSAGSAWKETGAGCGF